MAGPRTLSGRPPAFIREKREKTQIWASPAIMLATAAPSLAASLPLVGTDVATWDAVISPHTSPASRTLVIGTQVNVSYFEFPPPTNVTLSVNVLLEVFLDEELTENFHTTLVPLSATFPGEFWNGHVTSNLTHTITDEEWDTIFGPTTTDATLHWRLTVNGVLLTPQGESGYYVPQRENGNDTNPQTGIVTMNNPDNALIDD